MAKCYVCEARNKGCEQGQNHTVKSRVVSLHPDLHECQKVPRSIAVIVTGDLDAGFVPKTTRKLNYLERKQYVTVRGVASRVAAKLRGPTITNVTKRSPSHAKRTDR